MTAVTADCALDAAELARSLEQEVIDAANVEESKLEKVILGNLVFLLHVGSELALAFYQAALCSHWIYAAQFSLGLVLGIDSKFTYTVCVGT